MSNAYVPPAGNTQVALIPGLIPSDGGDKFFAPRNVIAFAIILLFGFEVAAPYLIKMPAKEDTEALNLILTSSKTVETVLVLVLGFFFGTTIGGQKKDETIRQQALAATPLALPPPDPATLVTASLIAEAPVKEPTNVAQPDAAGGAQPTAVAAAAPGLQAGDGRPAE